METQISTANSNSIDVAKEHLRRGEIVAIPTETVYGLAANALDSSAISKIYQAKGRPSDNPLIIHISSLEMLYKLLKEPALSSFYESLVKEFWPGPLTLLFPKSDLLPSIVTGGSEVMAIRMPCNPWTLELIESCGFPLAAPSANTSGRPSPTLALHVYNDLKGKIPLILDGGPCVCGIESTVVNGLLDPPVILRPGGVSLEDLSKFDSRITMALKSNPEIPTTPGMKYKHYTPNVPVILFEKNGNQSQKLQEFYSTYKGKRIGILSTNQSIDFKSNDLQVVHLHLGDSPTEIAQGLFNGLLHMESQDLSALFVQGISEKDIGLGIMNRLRKAAWQIV